MLHNGAVVLQIHGGCSLTGFTKFIDRDDVAICILREIGGRDWIEATDRTETSPNSFFLEFPGQRIKPVADLPFEL